MRTQKQNEELNIAIREEQKLTALWYSKMSGQVPWNDGERDRFQRRFDALAEQIYRLWALND